jgi:HlyD family secretion protein
VFEAQIAAAEAVAREANADLRRVATLAARAIYAQAGSTTPAPAPYGQRQGPPPSKQRDAAGPWGRRQDQVRAADARVRQAQASSPSPRAASPTSAPAAPSAPGSRTSSSSRANGRRPTSRSSPCCPTTASRCASSSPSRPRRLPSGPTRVASPATAASKGPDRPDRLRQPTPEFTPPVIYSREARDRLVYLVEARPDRPADLRPASRSTSSRWSRSDERRGDPTWPSTCAA